MAKINMRVLCLHKPYQSKRSLFVMYNPAIDNLKMVNQFGFMPNFLFIIIFQKLS